MSGTQIPATYSMLSTNALRVFVENQYAIGTVKRCKFLARGLNDTYHVTTDRAMFILRVYRKHWRSKANIAYELDVLRHLHEHQIPVSYPLENKRGDVILAVDAPEGTRYLALFTYAIGIVPPLDHESSHAYGETMALIHNITDDFSSRHERVPLNLDHLLDQPLKVIATEMTDDATGYDFIFSVAARIRHALNGHDLDVGFCHGDCHDWNARWHHGTLTLFDFDCSGIGYRAYDMAVFLWNLKVNYKAKESDSWKSFLHGYAQHRALKRVDLDAIPHFVSARRIWLAGVYLSNEDIWGSAIINARFFQAFVAQLQEDETSLSLHLE